MSTSDTSVPQVIINKLTQAQYDTATKNPNEFYAIIDANPGASSVTYYATSDNTQGFPTYYTYLYSDSARTTVVTPDTILNNFENGNTILIEYESTQTGSSAYKMTLTVATMALDGDDVYRMTVIELNEYNTTYNCVTACLSTAWDGQSSFNGRWGIARNTRPVVNDGTLTIQHNGTTKGTFTANQSTASTVNIETIYADDYISTSPIPTTVTTAMIENGAVTAAKTAFGGNYSTTEVNTGFTWTGGETIYKKTIHGTFSSVPSSGLSWNHSISGLSYVIKIETAYKLGWEMAWGNDGFLARAGMAVRVDNTKVYIDTNSSNSYSGAVDVTLWYTKSS